MPKSLLIFCKTIAFLAAVMVGTWVFIFFVSLVVPNLNDKRLYISDDDTLSFGEVYDVENIKEFAIQNELYKRNDIFPIRGSSELSTFHIPAHPIHLFKDKRAGFQIDLEGKGHNQSLLHAIAIAALDDSLGEKPFAFIVSSQWFEREGGAYVGEFQANFSEVQYAKMLENPVLSENLKGRIVSRTEKLLDGSVFFRSQLLTKYALDKVENKSLLGKLVSPVKTIVEKTISNKDLVNAKNKYRIMKSSEELRKIKNSPEKIDWESVLSENMKDAHEKVTNNEFYINDNYFITYIEKNLTSYKDTAYNAINYKNSIEYDDFQIFLDVCTEISAKPLIVLAPVNGKWYDYCGAPKEARENFYKRLSKMIQDSGLKVLDLSYLDYEPYVMSDIMHIGWKGWIEIDKEIVESYDSYR